MPDEPGRVVWVGGNGRFNYVKSVHVGAFPGAYAAEFAAAVLRHHLRRHGVVGVGNDREIRAAGDVFPTLADSLFVPENYFDVLGFTPCFAARTWVQGTVTVRLMYTLCFSRSSMLAVTSPAVLFSTGTTP